LFLEGLAALHEAGRLAFFGDLAPLADKRAFDAALAPLRRSACRVDGDVAVPIPHRPGRAEFRHPVLHERDSLAAAYPWAILAGGSGWRFRSSLRRAQRTTLWRSRRDNHFCHHRDGALRHLVLEGWNAEHPLRAIRFWDVRPADRRRAIAAGLDAFEKVQQIGLQV